MMSKKARESEPNSKKSSQFQHRKSKRAHKSKKSKDPKMMSGSGRKGVIMAQCVPPGDIVTQPGTKIVLSAPYEDNHTYHIEIVNSSARRIGWAIKTTNIKRIGVYPGCGVLDPKEAILMAVSCDAFAYRQEDAKNDRIYIEWINTPDGAAKQFRREWLLGDCVFRRKCLPIEYNP